MEDRFRVPEEIAVRVAAEEFGVARRLG